MAPSLLNELGKEESEAEHAYDAGASAAAAADMYIHTTHTSQRSSGLRLTHLTEHEKLLISTELVDIASFRVQKSIQTST
jgi:hypothetical protein